MSNLFVKNILSIKERTFKIRSKMSSSELNALQKEAFDDILDLFNKANQLQKTIYEMNLANHIESSCYTKRLQEALDKIKELEENYANLIKEENEYRSLTKYAYEAKTLDTGYDAIVDKNTNDIIAHIVNSTSKVRLYDETYDETVVPPSLQVHIGPDSFSDNVLHLFYILYIVFKVKDMTLRVILYNQTLCLSILTVIYRTNCTICGKKAPLM